MTSRKLQAKANGENEVEEEGSNIDLNDAPWNRHAPRLADGTFRRLTGVEMELYTLKKMEQRGLLGDEHWLKDHRCDDLRAIILDLHRNTDLRKQDTRPGRLARMLWRLDAMLVAEVGPNAFMRILDQRIGDVAWLRARLARLRGEENLALGEFQNIAEANEGLQQPQLIVPAQEQLEAAVEAYEQQLGRPLYDPAQWQMAEDDGMNFEFNVQARPDGSPEELSFDELFQEDFNAIQGIPPPQPWLSQPSAHHAGGASQEVLSAFQPLMQQGNGQALQAPSAALQDAPYDIDDFDFDQFIVDEPGDQQGAAQVLQHALQPGLPQTNLPQTQQQAPQLPQTPPPRPSGRNTGLNGRYWQNQRSSAATNEADNSGSSYQTRSGRAVRPRPFFSSGQSSKRSS